MAQNVRSTRRTSTARKVKRTLSSGQVHVFASFNNTIVTVTDQQGNAVCWGSSGSAGFKGSRKSTPFAARLAAEQAIKAAHVDGNPGSGSDCQGTWSRSRIGHPCRAVDGYQGAFDCRYHPGAAQWLPASRRNAASKREGSIWQDILVRYVNYAGVKVKNYS